jgi:hypothetical protein
MLRCHIGYHADIPILQVISGVQQENGGTYSEFENVLLHSQA